ncbi:MAG: hypothetical protein ACK559_09940, partial [bacterium]
MPREAGLLHPAHQPDDLLAEAPEGVAAADGDDLHHRAGREVLGADGGLGGGRDEGEERERRGHRSTTARFPANAPHSRRSPPGNVVVIASTAQVSPSPKCSAVSF